MLEKERMQHNTHHDNAINDYIKRITASDMPEKCKTDKLINESLTGMISEGRHCYLKDKLDKIDAGGLAVIETGNLAVNYKKYINPDEYLIEVNPGALLVISKEKSTDYSREIFKSNKIDRAFVCFTVGHKEVPDFHRALYCLKRRNNPYKIPAKILRVAIKQDDNLTLEEKEYISSYLKKQSKDGYLKTSVELAKAIHETLQSVKNDCDSPNALVKGLSLTGSSTFEFHTWNVAPLKKWISDNNKNEL